MFIVQNENGWTEQEGERTKTLRIGACTYCMKILPNKNTSNRGTQHLCSRLHIQQYTSGLVDYSFQKQVRVNEIYRARNGLIIQNFQCDNESTIVHTLYFIMTSMPGRPRSKEGTEHNREKLQI